MSEVAEKEQELVSGTIGGITQKKADTWTVAVTPEGSQYAKNLWTKSTSLVEALQGKLGQHGAFVCNASYWTRQDGQQVRSLWIEAESDGTENVPERVATPSAPVRDSGKGTGHPVSHVQPQPRKPSDEMSKEEWARKDSAIHKMACIKTAADALKHTVPSDPTPEDLTQFLSRVTTLTLAWHRQVLAERDDPTGMDIPF
jgi:leucyl aminopeptidase (aminopeptidase T)